jgi:ABC-type hemin transport system substrate-binding protein
MRDDLGHELALAGEPHSIVSLVPSLTELVAEWGLAHALVGVTDYCTSPPDAFADAARIRGTKNPDTARIVSLRPDLVLADQEENRRIDVERLRAAGLDVWVTSVRSVRDVAASVRRLGEVLARPDAGDQLAGAILAEVAAVERDPEVQRSVPSVCMIWRDGPQRGPEERWWSVGAETFAGDLLRCAGLPPIVVGEDARYPQATLAAIREAGPRVVLLPDEPYAFGDDDEAVFDDWDVAVVRCSGQPLFWWGPRTPEAIRWLRTLAADPGGGAPGPSGTRSASR